MVKLGVAAAMILATAQVAAFAQTPLLGGTLPPPPPVVAPPSVAASPGPAQLTAPPVMRSIVIPGSPLPGTVYDNGNGTSTVVVPGGGSQVIPTPR